MKTATLVFAAAALFSAPAIAWEHPTLPPAATAYCDGVCKAGMFNNLTPSACQVTTDNDGNVFTYLVGLNNYYLEVVNDPVLANAALVFCRSTIVGFFVTNGVTGAWDQIYGTAQVQ